MYNMMQWRPSYVFCITAAKSLLYNYLMCVCGTYELYRYYELDIISNGTDGAATIM